jgi:hypothetical protein
LDHYHHHCYYYHHCHDHYYHYHYQYLLSRGWSIGICLTIPSALLSASREKRLSRKVAENQEKCRVDFAAFASQRLSKSDSKSSTVSETAIINSFRRTYVAYRYKMNIDNDGDAIFDNYTMNNDGIDDKFIKKIIRNYIGVKPVDGIYQNMVLLNTRKDALEENKILVSKANKMRQEFLKNSSYSDNFSSSDSTSTSPEGE